ncbi:MAG: hypothetical protein COA81_06870 [Alphaproteobacteria bacterium]|nr:MAG: hypothetical protein COA81_06870 [Alphaproteobacteria bacterium]
MSYIKGKIIAVLLVLLVFVGQTATADAMSCQMDAEISVAINDTASTEHPECPSDDMGSYNLLADMDSSGCCLEDCGCPIGNLVSAILFSSPQNDWATLTFQENGARPFLVVSHPLSTLFRPPIA